MDVLSKELDNTAVPLPFKIYATLKTSKFDKVEKQIHKQIDRLTDLRISQNCEFFNIAPSVSLDIMCDIADLLDDSELAVYVDGKSVISNSKAEDKKIEVDSKEKERKAQKPPFKFHMVGLKVGDTVVFDELNLPITIASDDKFEYQGRLWSLSALTREFLPEEKQITSGAYEGPKYFSYERWTLSELRKDKEK